MKSVVHITTQNYLSYSNNQLVLQNKEKDENRVSFNNILAVVIENSYCIISIALQLKLSEYGIPLIICNKKFQPVSHSLPLYTHYHLTTRIKEQINWSERQKKEAWREIIKTKIMNQKKLLEHFHGSNNMIESLQNNLSSLENEDINIDFQEAFSSKIYFKALFGESFKRFSSDTINSSLNYGYALLRSLISSKIVAKGFHPSLAINHHSQFNNYNFSDDIIEIFRPMVDYIVYINQHSDFELDKEYRQKLLLVLKQKVYYNNKHYELGKAVELYIDNIRNFFLKDDKLILPEIRVDEYEY